MTRGEVKNIIILYNNILDATSKILTKESYDPENQGSVSEVFINNSWMKGLLNAIQIGGGMPVFVGDYSSSSTLFLNEAYIVKAIYEGEGVDGEVIHFETSTMEDLT